MFNGLREGVCGHIFECIDYYLFFKSLGVSCGIYLVYDDFNKEKFKKIIENKYGLGQKEIEDLIEDTLIESIKDFYSKKVYNFSKVKKFIFTEIHDFARIVMTRGPVLGINEIIGLRCGLADSDFSRISQKKYPIKIFQDFRIYGSSLQSWSTHDHKKRLFFDKYKRPTALMKNTAFIYLSTECRNLEKNYIKDIIQKYLGSMNLITFSVKNPSEYIDLMGDQVHFYSPPMNNFNNLFDTFIYVPLERKFDCSPRLVAESYLFGKKVIYHDINDSYFKIDKGLYWRNYDCLNDLEDIKLTEKDSLVEYVLNTI